MSRSVSLHGWSAPTLGKHTLQLSNIALEQTTCVWLEWLTHFEVLSLRIMLFLVPIFFLVFSICALYDNVRSRVVPKIHRKVAVG